LPRHKEIEEHLDGGEVLLHRRRRRRVSLDERGDEDGIDFL